MIRCIQAVRLAVTGCCLLKLRADRLVSVAVTQQCCLVYTITILAFCAAVRPCYRLQSNSM